MSDPTAATEEEEEEDAPMLRMRTFHRYIKNTGDPVELLELASVFMDSALVAELSVAQGDELLAAIDDKGCGMPELRGHIAKIREALAINVIDAAELAEKLWSKAKTESPNNTNEGGAGTGATRSGPLPARAGNGLESGSAATAPGAGAVVMGQPGKAEADAILADYAQFRTGAVAWLRMGFRLIAVKEALPHGQFIAWCEEHFTNGKRASHLPEGWYRHFKNAKMVAERFGESIGILPGVVPNDDALAEIVDGRSQRKLLLDARELKDDPGNYQAKCEELWQADPDLRDEWEPRVMCGELSYGKAYAGMMGAAMKTRPPIQWGGKAGEISRDLPRYIERAGGWDKLSDTVREFVIEGLKETLSALPDSVRRVLIGKGDA